jgi:hypothetical protein
MTYLSDFFFKKEKVYIYIYIYEKNITSTIK